MIKDETIDIEPALLERLREAEFSIEQALPTVTVDNDQFAVFPLTDIQRGYFMGRNPELTLGGSSCQFYYEVDCTELDIAKYQTAWQQIIQRHSMLRAIILNASEQKILKEVPELILPVHDLRNQKQPEDAIDAIRERIIQTTRPSDQWPLFDVEVSRMANGHVRIHLGFDLLIADQYSILILMQEVAIRYREPKQALPSLAYTFRDYVTDSAHSQQAYRQRAKKYWVNRLSEIPESPTLPLMSPLHQISKPMYQRISRQIDKSSWQRVKDLAIDIGVTPSCILLALYSEVLSHRVEGDADSKHFSLNVPLFNRQSLHTDVNKIVGEFTSNFLFSVDLRQKLTRRELFTKVQADLWQGIQHSSFSAIEVMSEMARNAGHLDQPLMPVIFTCTLSQADTALFNSANTQLGTPIFDAGQTPQAILDNILVEWEGQLQINWDVTTNALDIDLAHQLLKHYADLITQIGATKQALDTTVGDLVNPTESMVLPVAKKLSEYSRLSDIWLENLPQCLTRPALKTGSITFTHQDLAEQVSGLCQSLCKAGIVKDDIVCITLDKSAEQIVSCLAVSILGAVYVPIDNEQPKARIEKIISELQPRLIISKQDSFSNTSENDAIAQLNLTGLPLGNLSELYDYPKATEDALAYIIYTSGSTGMPKGVCVNHRASINTCLDINQRFGLSQDDCVLGLSALHFDLSVFDIFGVLGVGGSIAIPDKLEIQNPSHWLEICQQQGVTVWNSVPALWSLFIGYLKLNPDKNLPKITTTMLSGDWIPLTLVPDTRDIFSQLNFYSLGGATEAAIWSIYYPIDELDPTWNSIPYGKALGGQQVFVLNKELQMTLPGQSGDIYIAGVGLATGYYNDPEKTEQHFFKHPQTGLDLYRTGDIGNYLPDGNIEFKGRLDNQLKINGYRVELGEISRTILVFDDVNEAIVLPVESTKQLTAFITVANQSATSIHQVTHNQTSQISQTIKLLNWSGLDELKQYLASQLPTYMLPVQWCVISNWPLTENGKVDMAALKSLGSEMTVIPPVIKAVENNVNPAVISDDLSKQVLTIVADVLKIEHVGLDDNLVSLGASSVELIELASRVEKLTSQRPPLPELARAVQLSDLVALVSGLFSAENYATPLFPQENTFRHFLENTAAITDANSRKLFKSNQQQPIFSGEKVSLKNEKERTHSRNSWHNFSSSPSTLEQIADLLSPLRQYYTDGQKKRHYSSAGGLYPIEIYLIHDGEKVQGLPSGSYFYDADNHALQNCYSPQSTPTLSTLSSRNSDWLDNAHFVMCLVMRMDVCVPLYEAASLPFGLIECGAICQLLEQESMSGDIGLCQVGDMSLSRLSERLGLSDDRVCLHVVAGGAIDSEQWQQQEADYSQAIIEGEL